MLVTDQMGNAVGYTTTDNQYKCVDCGKIFDATGRDFKILYEVEVPFRVAPLRQPMCLCKECEEKRVSEAMDDALPF